MHSPEQSHESLFVVAVAALIVRGGRILSMRRSRHKDAGPGLWETLSGRVLAGEEPLAAVAREIDEECGLAVDLDPRPVTAYSTVRIDLPMVVIVYRGLSASGEVLLSEEHEAYAWLTPDELAQRSPLQPLVAAARTALLLPWSETGER